MGGGITVGHREGALAPWTASSLAFSFPTMFECPLTHSGVVMFSLDLRVLMVVFMIPPISEFI